MNGNIVGNGGGPSSITIDSAGKPAVVVVVGDTVNVSEQRNVYGLTPVTDIWGIQSAKDALPDGAGKGASTFIVDCRQYGLGRCVLGVLMATGAVTHTASVSWSATGLAADAGQADADEWAAQTGNQQSILDIKDNYAHITLTQITGTAEDIYAYLSGRELA
ncbi:hypothetical protein KAU11_10110 [Candidatus Babeliales bacterium]|nr:hypothetical protein [Candidatus Babeliales bacterium]